MGWWLEYQSCAYAYGHNFLFIGSNYEMENSGLETQYDASQFSYTGGLKMLDVVPVFTSKSGLDHSFAVMGPSSDYMVFFPKEIKECATNMTGAL